MSIDIVYVFPTQSNSKFEGRFSFDLDPRSIKMTLRICLCIDTVG